jgi:hypothetical protein
MVARENNPYLLRLSLDGVVVDEIPVCMSESRLTRMHLRAHSSSVQVETLEFDGTPLVMPMAVRLSVCQAVGISRPI